MHYKSHSHIKKCCQNIKNKQWDLRTIFPKESLIIKIIKTWNSIQCQQGIMLMLDQVMGNTSHKVTIQLTIVVHY
jgi:hypothetical protein